jgi:ankyrin repeat protein
MVQAGIIIMLNKVKMLALPFIFSSGACYSNSETMYIDFFQAVKNNQYNEVQMMIKDKLDVNGLYFGSTLFQVALLENCSETMVKLFLQNGANLNSKDISGLTPYITSFSKGDVSCTEMLTTLGGDPTVIDKYGNSAVYYAVDSGNLETVKLAFELGAKLDSPGHKGITPFMMAVNFNNYKIAKELLMLGAKKCRYNSKNELFIKEISHRLSDKILTLFSNDCK